MSCPVFAPSSGRPPSAARWRGHCGILGGVAHEAEKPALKEARAEKRKAKKEAKAAAKAAARKAAHETRAARKLAKKKKERAQAKWDLAVFHASVAS